MAQDIESTFIECKRQLMSVALQLTSGHMQNADDLLQDTYISACASHPPVDEIGNIRAWLFRVMKNVYGCNLRKAACLKRPKIADQGEPKEWQHPVEGSAESGVYMRDSRITHAIRAVPERYRRIFYLSEVEGYSHREIAELEGISYDLVRARSQFARKKFKAAY